ncbi:hypothetical protein LR48_Vigan107s001500 [Vigna angularis]|uniref:Nucleotide-diphospho-sugar transferase domain-containing protein n=1 Tax=Phaseolus angularis TaxID=3914 RepID=A0A0L9T593_PHAAN|nr:hypothetical protein LR48_Vigan107s001500 [Vigna angularis]
MSSFLHQRTLQNPFSNPFPVSASSSTNSKRPFSSVLGPTTLLALLALVVVVGVFCPWVGMPQALSFTLTSTSAPKWDHYTLEQALSFVAKNGSVIVCIVSQPYLPFLNNWLISIAMQDRQDMVLVIAEDYASLHRVNDLWPGHAVLIPPVLDAEAAHKFGSQGFFNFTARRPRHLLKILELGYSVMYNDVDMVWLADPFPYLVGNHDVYFTDDMTACLDSGKRCRDSGKRRGTAANGAGQRQTARDSGKRRGTAANDAGQRQTAQDSGKQRRTTANGACTAENGAGTASAAETKHTTQKGREREVRRDNRKRRGLLPMLGRRRVTSTHPRSDGEEAVRGGAWGRVRRRHRWGWSSREEANQIQWSSDETVTVAGNKTAADWPERSAAWRRVTERWLSKPAWLAVARRDGPDPQIKPLNHSHDLPPPGKKGRPYICSCMIFLHPTNEAKLVLKKWIEELQIQPWSKTVKSNDQPAFNWALMKIAKEVDMYLLPQAAFPTGGLYFKNKTWVKETKGMHVIIHNNYIVGFEKKIKRFRDYGLWLVDDHAQESPLDYNRCCQQCNTD